LPEVLPIPDHETSTAAEVLATFLYLFGVPWELHSDEGRSVESRLLLEVLALLRVCKTGTTLLHSESEGIVGRYMSTIEKHLRNVVSTYQRFGRRLYYINIHLDEISYYLLVLTFMNVWKQCLCNFDC
jgi:hypothetical protein